MSEHLVRDLRHASRTIGDGLTLARTHAVADRMRDAADTITDLLQRATTAERDLAAMRKERDELRAAVQDLLRLRGATGNVLNDFEDIGDWFYQETGFIRPGKDCRLNDPDVRRTHYDAWVKGKIDRARAALTAKGADNG